MRAARAEYQRRLNDRCSTVARLERQHVSISFFRLTAAAIFLSAGFARLIGESVSGKWLLLPAITFVVLVFVHEHVGRAKQRATQAVTFYEDGLARIDDQWMGRGQSTELLRDENHLYAADLDVFGKGSLFELLCTARLRAGQNPGELAIFCRKSRRDRGSSSKPSKNCATDSIYGRNCPVQGEH